METIVRRLKLLGCVPNQHLYLTFDFIDVFGAVVYFVSFNSAFDMREGACETEYRVHLGASQTPRVPPEDRDVCLDLFALPLVRSCRLASIQEPTPAFSVGYLPIAQPDSSSG